MDQASIMDGIVIADTEAEVRCLGVLGFARVLVIPATGSQHKAESDLDPAPG